MTLPIAGAFYGYYRYPWFAHASAIYQGAGDGHQDLRAGAAWLLSAMGQRALGQNWAVQLGFDSRVANKNRFSGVADPDSGGFLGMATAGIALRVFTDLNLHACERRSKSEDTSIRFGLAYDL